MAEESPKPASAPMGAVFLSYASQDTDRGLGKIYSVATSGRSWPEPRHSGRSGAKWPFDEIPVARDW